MVRRTPIAAAVVSLMVLAACDTSGEPSAPPTSQDALTTATSSPPEDEVVTSEPVTEEPETEEPEAEGPPEMPAEAMEQTEAGAEAFVGHYLDTYNYSFTVANSKALADLTSQTCESCLNLSQSVPDEPLDGEPYVKYTGIAGLATPDGARVTTSVTQRSLDGGNPTEGTILFYLSPQDEGWLIDEIQVVQP